ncbi:MAG TPA: hypothetical protein PKC72_15100 [Chitinophagaceae bacterium]|nr:hypothetical protein [Chitinophagaceae bacterium]
MKLKVKRLITFCCLFIPLITASQTIGIIQHLSCTKDTSQKYALYIPAKYDEQKLNPLLIFFDPAARGDFPIHLYQTLADNYGIIMAGSFNSQNFNGQSSVDAFVAVYNDIVGRYSIAPDKIWLAGFSGGARAASLLAMNFSEVSGVIGCGAGFADNDQLNLAGLKSYAAIVGDKDMNYSELMENSKYLDEKRVRNILLVFHGEHSWPPPGYMKASLEWLIDDTSVPVPPDNHLLSLVRAKADSGYLYEAWFEAKELSKIKIYKDSAVILMNLIQKQEKFNSDRELFQRVSNDETNCMNSFSLLFSSMIFQDKDIDDKSWKNILSQVTEMCYDKNIYRQLAGIRCLDHCIRSCREQFQHYMIMGQYNEAVKVGEVLTVFMSSEFTSWYFLARAEAGAERKKQSQKYLEQAISKGLKWSERIKNDQLLLKVFSLDELQKVFNKE